MKAAQSSAGFGGLDSFFKESEEQRERIRRNKRRNRNKDVVDVIDTHDKDKRKRSKADRRAAVSSTKLIHFPSSVTVRARFRLPAEDKERGQRIQVRWCAPQNNAIILSALLRVCLGTDKSIIESVWPCSTRG